MLVAIVVLLSVNTLLLFLLTGAVGNISSSLKTLIGQKMVDRAYGGRNN